MRNGNKACLVAFISLKVDKTVCRCVYGSCDKEEGEGVGASQTLTHTVSVMKGIPVSACVNE